MLLVLIGISIIFQFLTHGTFLSARNLTNLIVQTSALAIVAMGMSMIIVSGNIDLSVGSVIGLTGSVAGSLMLYQHWGTVPTILVTLALGGIIGCWQGFWVAYRKVPAFIVTLAGMLIFRGIVVGVGNGVTIAPLNETFTAVGQGFLPVLFAIKNSAFKDTSLMVGIAATIIYIILLFNSRKKRIQYNLEVMPLYFVIIQSVIISAVILGLAVLLGLDFGIPYSMLVVIVVAIFLSFVAMNTAFGRHIYAIGGNKEASRLSGINIKNRIFLLFLLMGLLTAASGIIYAARLNASTAAAGTNMELDAIAGAIIGGKSLMGGEGTIFGAMIGALIMTSLDNGMTLMNVPYVVQNIVKGLVLLIAVWVDISTRNRTE